MIFEDALNETTLFTKGGGKKTKHDPKRNKFAHKDVNNKEGDTDIHVKEYEKAVKNGTAYTVWVNNIKTKI